MDDTWWHHLYALILMLSVSFIHYGPVLQTHDSECVREHFHESLYWLKKFYVEISPHSRKCALFWCVKMYRSMKITPAKSKFRSNDKTFWGAKTPRDRDHAQDAIERFSVIDLNPILWLVFTDRVSFWTIPSQSKAI